MLENIAALAIAALFEIAQPYAMELWTKISNWASEALLGWITTDLTPQISQLTEETVKLAFTVVTTVAIAVKQAWETLRKYLLELVINFERSSEQWIKRLTSKFIKISDSGQPIIVTREVEEVIDWEELPGEVRKNVLMSSVNSYPVNYAEIRDQEMQAMSLVN